MEHIYETHSKRNTINLCGEWQYCLDKSGKGENEKWYESFPEDYNFINIPGCWNLELGLYEYVGKVWFRKEIETDDTYIKLSFGAVTGLAEVYLDGEHLGSHYGGWLMFSFEKFVAKGKHCLVVCVDNTSNNSNTIPLKYVDWYNYGGITRSVKVETFNKPFIKKSKIMYTLSDDLSRAELCAYVTISNPFGYDYNTDVSFFCGDKLLKTVNTNISGEQIVEIKGIELKDIKLWDIYQGNLYDFKIATKDDDEFQKIGFRKIEARDKAIYLNNKPIFVKGVNRHEQHPDWGFVMPSNLNKRDLQIIKDLGCNMVRGAHYPNTHTFIDYLDREGLLFWSEIPMWGFTSIAVKDELTLKRAKIMPDEMIEQYYHHPSIIIWGLHNEIVTDTKEGYDITEKLYNFVNEKDDTRLITYTTNRFLDDISFKFSDVICINQYFGWYEGDINSWKGWFKELRNEVSKKGCPQKPIIISEFGCPSLIGHNSFNEEKWSTQYQSKLLKEVIQNSVEQDGVCGTLIWHFSDTTSDKDIAKARGFNNKGIVDEYRRPKLTYYIIKELFDNINDWI